MRARGGGREHNDRRQRNGAGLTAGPYAEAWESYRRAGWLGVLPLPVRSKAHPPKAFTGDGGVWPSTADCMAWGDGPEARGNVALRLPWHVLGVDVDNYDGKPGGATVADAEAKWGALPATWRTTSRDDGVSGIRLYRVPEGLHWPGKLGAGTELIQYRHRYAVVWPSVHPEGRTYRWITPEGVTAATIPDPDTLPLLPAAWVDGLTGGVEHTATPRNDWGAAAVQTWIVSRPGAVDAPCARTRRAVAQALEELAAAGSAHEAMTAGVMRAVRLADEGHAGLAAALADVHTAFLADVTRTGRPGAARDDRAAENEWRRAVEGAVNKVSATSSDTQTCDCAGQLTGLVVGGAYPVDGTAAVAPLHTTRPDPTEPQPDDQPHDQPDPDPTRPDQNARERTTWWPRNLGAVLAGEEEEPPPAVLTRFDGRALLYAGKINGILGESESGKTWVALEAVRQRLADGARVTYLDFEDSANGIVARLRALAVPDADFARLAYIEPDQILDGVASDDLREHLDQTRPDLIILDGVNAAMTLLGLDLTSNTDATKFNQLLLRPLSLTGACVVVVDHVPKNKDNRGKGGIGAQAKRAMMTGCALLADVAEPFGRGMTGRLRLYVDKDRPGHVRAISAEAKFAGTAVLESDADTGGVVVTIRPPDNAPTREEKQQGRNSLLMEAISDYLFTSPRRTSLAGIREATGRNRDDVKAALDELIERGHVERQGGGGRGGYEHKLVRVFSIADDLSTKNEPERTQTNPGVGGQGQAKTNPETCPPPVREGHGVRFETAGVRFDQATGAWFDPETGDVVDPPSGGVR